MMLWLLIAGMALVTYALRAGFLLLPPEIGTPALVRRALRFVPAAVITAVWAPELFLQKGALYLSPGNDRLLAGGLAIAVAWRSRSTLATILAGLLALHLIGWLKMGL
jgi:branched-subunit amino acid transport protein